MRLGCDVPFDAAMRTLVCAGGVRVVRVVRVATRRPGNGLAGGLAVGFPQSDRRVCVLGGSEGLIGVTKAILKDGVCAGVGEISFGVRGQRAILLERLLANCFCATTATCDDDDGWGSFDTFTGLQDACTYKRK